jgi:transcriptional regulator with XRE-family HTH domain
MDTQENPLHRLAQRLIQLREERFLTIEELATRAGLEPDLIRKIEAGAEDPTLTVLHALARALGLTGAELMKLL